MHLPRSFTSVKHLQRSFSSCAYARASCIYRARPRGAIIHQARPHDAIINCRLLIHVTRALTYSFACCPFLLSSAPPFYAPCLSMCHVYAPYRVSCSCTIPCVSLYLRLVHFLTCLSLSCFVLIISSLRYVTPTFHCFLLPSFRLSLHSSKRRMDLHTPAVTQARPAPATVVIIPHTRPSLQSPYTRSHTPPPH